MEVVCTGMFMERVRRADGRAPTPEQALRWATVNRSAGRDQGPVDHFSPPSGGAGRRHCSRADGRGDRAGAVATALAPWLATHDPQEIDPMLRLRGFSASHWLGTDALGRDIWSRTIHGGRASQVVGLIVALCATSIGLAFGLVRRASPSSTYPSGSRPMLIRLLALHHPRQQAICRAPGLFDLGGAGRAEPGAEGPQQRFADGGVVRVLDAIADMSCTQGAHCRNDAVRP